MKTPEFPSNEAERLLSLCNLDILDSPAEERFDRLTRIAQSHFKVPIALVSIVDADRQWFKSRQGLEATETDRSISFCGHAILGDEVFYVPNASEDPRFADNPLVTDPPNIRFYAGAPLTAPDGAKVGTLCVIDTEPRVFDEADFKTLRDLAACVEEELGQLLLKQFKSTLDLTMDSVFMFHADNLRFFYVNRGAFEQVGYSKDEMLTMHPYDIKPDIPEEAFRALITPLLSGARSSITFETVHAHKDGTRIPVEIFLQYIAMQGERPRFVAIVRDISERQESEQSLRDREQRLRAILDNVVDGIITIDSMGIIETYNPASERIFGFRPSEVIGKNVKMLMPSPYQEEHDGYLKHFRDTNEARIIGIGREVEGLRKDGSTFPLELAVSEMNTGGKQMFTGIVRDITERHQAEKMKREFVSTVSHELRTPLTSIKGSLGLIRSGVFGEFPEKLSKMLDIAHNNSDRLVRLINDILDIEKIESGKMSFCMEPLDLVPLLEQSIENNRAYAMEHGVSFKILSEITEAKIEGDHDRLMQVMTNLMSNAAKFSPEGSTVELSLSLGADKVCIEVRDYGPGIPESFHKSMFGKFAQADSSDTREKGGTGLGLNISRAIVEQHGGSIDFKTELGMGTSFYVELPLQQDSVLESELTEVELKKEHILVCEDDVDVANLLVRMLEQDGFTVDVAFSATEAEDLLKHQSYDGMTLDLGLPDKDGLSLLRELRARRETVGLPIVVISANAADGELDFQAEAFGVVDWHQKPIDQHRLAVSLRIAMASSDASKVRILHVEDDPDILQVVAGVVGDAANISSARTLSAARTLLVNELFDLVILDIGLPDGNGEELLSMIKATDNRMTPVIIFSATHMSQEMDESIKSSLVKSVTSNEDLLRTIHSAVSNRTTVKKKSV